MTPYDVTKNQWLNPVSGFPTTRASAAERVSMLYDIMVLAGRYNDY